MTGFEKAKEIAESLKKDVEAKVEQEQRELAEVKTELDLVRSNPELSKLYSESANMGANNLSGELPVLKVFTQGKSQSKLADGSKPKDGSFYYKPQQRQFDGITAHILTISRGFKAEGMDGKKEVFNQIVGGMIIDGTDLLPFIMYFTGKKLQNMWNFGKEAGKYTKMKPTPIPMFALTVKLSTQSETNDFGESWLVNFEIVKQSEGFPEVVVDPSEFQFLRDSLIQMEATISGIIDSKSKTELIQKVQTEDEMPF